jgi:alkanesulfonate monooxygenase SsuD/methylene tetrahydromethanopterin reductase-like flavin-dependent oxidoreductase (luciferase family)
MADVGGGGKRPTGTGLVLRDPLPWSDQREIVATAEQAGYSALFVPEIAARESFSTLASFACATTKVVLGTGVVAMWSRSPVATAMAAATVQDFSYGRLILGIGAGSRPPGADVPGGATDRLRRYVATVRTALSGRRVPDDDPFGAAGFVLAPELTDGPPPIWLGALGDRSVGLAGELADGVILNWCTPERVAGAREVIAEAASEAGRDPATVTVAVYVRACLGMSERVALEALRSATAHYAAIPHYRRQLERMGLGADAAAAAGAIAHERFGEVPERLVRALTVMGGRREALERFAAYREAGADLVLCYPVPALEPSSSIMGTMLAAAPDPAIEA